jgi:lipid-binding SYLF domain-containing protein
MTQATIGAQIGGQSYTQIVVFETESKLQDFMANKLTFTANASAVAVKAGAAAATQFQNGVAVFAHSDAGLMGEASVGGQQYRYQPMQDAEMAGHNMAPAPR